MSHAPGRKKSLRCSFCGKHQDQVQCLIAGPGVYICDACISLCNEILAVEPPTPLGLNGETADGSAPPAPAPWWQRLTGRWQVRVQS
jgi:hypothetical protein